MSVSGAVGRPQAQSRRVQDEARVIDRCVGPHDLHLGAELTGAEQIAMLASHRLGAGVEPDGAGDDGAALVLGERRDVGPGAGEIEAHGRRGAGDMA